MFTPRLDQSKPSNKIGLNKRLQITIYNHPTLAAVIQVLRKWRHVLARKSPICPKETPK